MTFSDLIPLFIDSAMFDEYKPNTQRQYKTAMNRVLSKVGKQSVDRFTAKDMSMLYDQFIEESGTTYANTVRNSLIKFFDWAMSEEYADSNPVVQVSRVRVGDKHTTTHQNIQKMLTSAYSQYKWRNAGILMHLSYESGEYVTDLLDVSWDKIDFDAGEYVGDRYRMPLTEDFLSMLKAQHEDFGFQPYVAPAPFVRKQVFQPYSESGFSKVVNKIRLHAGISPTFRVSDVRRTGLVTKLHDGMDMDVVVDILQPTDKCKMRYQLKKLMQELTVA